jgi:hypothetical protein
MSQYRFELATEADDADLRAVLARTPMPGPIAVTFRREPSYFAAAVVAGAFRQVVAARECRSGHIIGFGARSVTQRYVNGQPAGIGYLSDLRLLPEHRSRGLLARGYAFFRELHADQRTRLYLTTIAEGNTIALSLLGSGRAGLPRYHDAGRYHTFVLPLLRRSSRPRASASLSIRPARAADLPAVLAFLDAAGPRRQFFPRYVADDFLGPPGRFRDLRLENLLLAFRQDRLVGTLAGWDQSGFRQTVVHGYSAALRRLRPLYNAWAHWCGRPRLPPPGTAFRSMTAALPVVVDDDRDVFTALLDALVEKGRAGCCEYLVLGLADADPLLPVLRIRPAQRYTTRLFLVCWDDGEPLRAELDGRPPYLELGSL